MAQDRLYKDIRERINQLFGIYPNDWSSIEKSLHKAAKALDRPSDIEAIAQWMFNPTLSDDEYRALARYLTIGETYFFRELTGLYLLSGEIIPQRRKLSQKTLNIWSAGCSSGEEPYSIAIFLCENLPDIQNWNIRIIATDVNDEALNKARKGIYRNWSFRVLNDNLLKKYFTTQGSQFKIKKEIGQMVMFRPLNLAKGSFPEVEMDSKGFDIIFCRNVLMYFSGHMAKHITQKFFHSLTDGGFLVTSQTELSMNVSNRFRRIRFKDGFFFQKTVAAQSATPAKPAAASPNRKKESPGPSQRRPSRKEKTVPRTRPMNSTVRTSLQEKDIPAGSIKQLYDKADYSGCIQLYHNRQTGNNFSIEERFYISKSFANLGEYQTATAIMEELITHKASEPDFYYFYAIILSEQGRWWEAEKNLVKALYLKPVFISARFSYFLVLKKMNQHQKAAKERQNLLNDMANYSDDDLIPGMEGVTAGSLRQMMDLM